jgi:hypothetical protein
MTAKKLYVVIVAAILTGCAGYQPYGGGDINTQWAKSLAGA